MDEKERAAAVGRRLTELRGCRTRTGVARELGIAYSSLCNYEHGRRIPTDDVKIKIARYYGQHVGQIFFPKNYKETN